LGDATLDYLWTPDQDDTYAFLQGTGQATPYRKNRVADTFAIWNSRANLVVKELPWGLTSPNADIRIRFGGIPQGDILGWSVFANPSIGLAWDRAYIERNGGKFDITGVLSTTVIPENASPTKLEDQKSEEKLLFHELEHTLGLQHEHESALTDKPNPKINIAASFDGDSLMIYPGLEGS